MRRPVYNWNSFFAKLGLSRNGSPRARHRSIGSRRLRIEPLEDRRVLATLTVNVATDTHINTDGNLTLREAIEVIAQGSTTGLDSTTITNQISGSLGTNDTIVFDSSLSGSTITLSKASTFGQLGITKDLKIDASSLAAGITIEGQQTNSNPNNGDGIRLFNITAPSGVPTVEMIGMTLTGADPSPGLGTPEGGAIRSEGLLTLRDMTITQNGAGKGAGVYVAVAGGGSPRTVLDIENSHIDDNSAWLDGGAVYVALDTASNGEDSVIINGSTLSNNITFPSQNGNGGALFVSSSSTDPTINHTVTITASDFENNVADANGGAIYLNISRVELSIQGSTFNDNEATASNGGAIFAQLRAAASESTIQDSVLSGNTSGAGGGAIYINGYGGAQMGILESTVSGNSAGSSGGGVGAALSGASSFSIQKSDIVDNTSGGNGGGISAHVQGQSPLIIEDSTISGNVSSTDGGGVWAQAGADYSVAFQAITLSRSIISGNTAGNRGGGMYTGNFPTTETLIQDSRITGNEATTSGVGNGGGIYAYLHTYGLHAGRFTITRSTVDHNEADHVGGGIFVCAKAFGEFVAENSTFSSNETLDTTNGTGGGIYIGHINTGSIDAYLRNVTVTQNISAIGAGVATTDDSDMRLRVGNSIISDNFDHNVTPNPNNFDGAVYVDASTTPRPFDEVKYNIIGSGSTIHDVNGNTFTLDSSNVNNTNLTLNDNQNLGSLQYRGGPTPTHSLPSGSAAIDRGSNALAVDPFTSSSFTTDQRGAGFTRIYDTPGYHDSGAIVDIGAYEINPPKVIDVIMSNGTSDYHVPVGSGVQLKTVPLANITTITLVLSETIGTISSGDLTAKQHGTSTTYTPTSFSSSGNVATWTFSAFGANQLELKLDDSVLSNVGISLDGNWTNPTTHSSTGTSVFPSGDGTAGDDFVFYVTILPGDANGDGLVTFADYQILQNNFGGSGKTFVQGDFNGDGNVTFADYQILQNNFGANLSSW
jgi:hypothetical protein